MDTSLKLNGWVVKATLVSEVEKTIYSKEIDLCGHGLMKISVLSLDLGGSRYLQIHP